ncbi:MAG: hypothetical protein MRY83_20115 [Flavobacteriales bacterium]|nr:hypothetical protein [Flavobacteriales bacterium]
MALLSACSDQDNITNNGNLNNVSEKSLDNQLINIPGSRISIIPPENFKVSDLFIGLQNDENAAMQFYELPDGNFFSNAINFTKENFETKGVKVLKMEDLSIADYQAKYVIVQSQPQINNVSLVFGDSTFSVMMNAMYMSSSQETEKQILKSFNSIKYDKNLKIDPFALAKFSIDESNTKFKFSSQNAGSFFYTIDGAKFDPSSDEPSIVISSIPRMDGMSPNDISQRNIAGLEQNGISRIEQKNISTKDFNGYLAYEAELHGILEGKKCIFYQMILCEGEKAIIFLGAVRGDFDKNLQEIKNLVKTLKFK